MSEEKWYSPNRLLSHNALINICMSPRGNGKSYSAKDRIIKQWLKRGKQSVYVRRYLNELEDMKDEFWDDIAPAYPDLEFKVKGFKGYINDEVVVIFTSLTKSSSLKSKPMPLVDLIVFDEYIITKSTYVRYLKNEVVLLLELIETIFRLRDNGAILILGNAVSYVNPLFSYFDIVPDQSKRFQKFEEGSICLEMFTSNVFIEEKKKTRFGKLIKDRPYGKYAIDNEVLEDTSDFVKGRGSHRYNYICSFKYNSFKIGVWYNVDLDEYFCDEIIDNSNIHKFCILLEELEEGYHHVKNYNLTSNRIKAVKQAGLSGNIYFCSQEIKKTMQDRILKYL